MAAAVVDSVNSLREDALAIWQAGVDAVKSDRLVQQRLCVDGRELVIAGQRFPLDAIGRIVVVGCGKAGAGMAAGVEQALGDQLLDEKSVQGWVNVPEDCVRDLQRIHLHGARPPGVNEPTEAGVVGAARILELVEQLGPDDLCLCLISGGGSALLPAPVPGVSLADKQAITRFLSGRGANIQQLNTVRKQLSRIKGGGLARACKARLVALIISDVLGDPLDVIASGPTVTDSSTPAAALAVLEQFGAREAGVAPAAFAYLEAACHRPQTAAAPTGLVDNIVIGNNATAVAAAAGEAVNRGYMTEQEAVTEFEGEANELGRRLAAEARRMGNLAGRRALVSGGEPIVTLAPPDRRGKGGRNQQAVLAALQELLANDTTDTLEGITILSGGTDGEDGPTPVAGAFIDAQVARKARSLGLPLADFLDRNDTYHFFEPLAALIHTGPTHTNVCDLRIVLTAR